MTSTRSPVPAGLAAGRGRARVDGSLPVARRPRMARRAPWRVPRIVALDALAGLVAIASALVLLTTSVRPG